jgi:hypothetical protein
VVFRVAVGKANGVLITRRASVAREREAGRVELMEAQVEACVGTDRQRQCLQEQVTAIRRGFIEGAAKLAAVAHLGIEACTQPQSEGLVGKKLRW